MESTQMVREAKEQVLVNLDEACMSSGKITREMWNKTLTLHKPRDWNPIKDNKTEWETADISLRSKGNTKEHGGL